MTKRLAAYIILLASVVYMSLLYEGEAMTFLIAFGILLPVIMAVIVIIQKKDIEIEYLSGRNIVGKSDIVEIEALVKYKIMPLQLLLPVHRISVGGKCICTDKSEKKLSVSFEKQENEQYAETYKNERQILSLTDVTAHYGVVKIELNRVKMYDYMSLFAIGLPFRYSGEVFVFPQDRPLTIDIRSLKSNNGVRIDNICIESKGRSQESINDPREYRPGDPMKRIHWKVSARIDKLTVKEYAGLMSSNILLLIDGMPKAPRAEYIKNGMASRSMLGKIITNKRKAANTTGSEEFNSKKDKWIENVFLISSALDTQFGVYHIGWMQDGVFSDYKIESRRDYSDAMQTFIRAQQDRKIGRLDKKDGSAMRANIYGRYTTVLEFTPDGVVRVEGEELTGLA